MADAGKTGAARDAAAQADREAAEFAALPRSRSRHPALALGAAVLAIFLVVKMRDDLRYFASSRHAEDLGDARALVASERGRAVLADASNRLVRIHGTPDRESALQVDTKGSWTFTQLFRLLGTGNRLFVHRREDPLPAERAEQDVFEGRLVRFADLSYEEAIRRYFAAHVSATHFFDVAELRRALAPSGDQPVQARDRAGDLVTLGPNDVLAMEVVRPGELEVAIPTRRFADQAAARAAIQAKGAHLLRDGRTLADRHNFVVAVGVRERDALLERLSAVAPDLEIREARETVKARVRDLTFEQGAAGAWLLGVRGEDAPGGGDGRRVLDGLVTVRTLATLQIPDDAYLIEEAEVPQDHLFEVAIAAVLLAFAAVNLGGLFQELRR